MPELPEVETVVRGLRAIVSGQTIRAITFRGLPKNASVSPRVSRHRTLHAALTGRTIERVDRRGKNIIMRLTDDVVLWVHLKMTGQFHYLPADHPPDKHHLVIYRFESFEETGKELIFRDYRRFGYHKVLTSDELQTQPGYTDLGPEPLTMSAEEFVALAHRRPRQLKQALLDQSFIAGCGNIYADESLFAARLHPRRLTTTVSKRKLTELFTHLQTLLQRSIDLMGTSVDTYRGINGQVGSFQKYLLAYNREGEPCPRCGQTLRREKIGSRSAHYCPKCQRAPRRSPLPLSK